MDETFKDSGESQDPRIGQARKIARFGLIFSLIFSLLSVGTLLSSPDSQTSSSSNIWNAEEITENYESVDASWVPAGYSIWSSDSSVAWRYAARHDCDIYDCIQVEIISRSGCPNSLYAALNWLDSSEYVLSYDNASLPSVRAMQVAKLRFDDIDGSAKTGEVAEISCR